MPTVRQLVLDLESKPGVLAKVSQTLADAGVNMTALCAPEAPRRGKLRLLVSDVPRAKEALKAAKYRATQEGAVTVAVENRPGPSRGIAEKLAQARIKIKCAYVTGEGDKQLIVLSVDRLGPSNGEDLLGHPAPARPSSPVPSRLAASLSPLPGSRIG